jgi:hypothetical protein
MGDDCECKEGGNCQIFIDQIFIRVFTLPRLDFGFTGPGIFSYWTQAPGLPEITCLSTMSSNLADRKLILRVLGQTVEVQRTKRRGFIFQDVLEDTGTPAGQPVLIRKPEDEV